MNKAEFVAWWLSMINLKALRQYRNLGGRLPFGDGPIVDKLLGVERVQLLAATPKLASTPGIPLINTKLGGVGELLLLPTTVACPNPLACPKPLA